jgi:type II secretory pathway pseudopilin PulG
LKRGIEDAPLPPATISLANFLLKLYTRSMFNLIKNKKGLSLAELILVVFILGLLGTIAVTSYVGSTATFKFLSEYKNLTSSLDTARSYAITNKQFGEELPERYGVCLGNKKIVVFADLGETDFSSILSAPNCGNSSSNLENVVKQYSFEDYSIEAYDSQPNSTSLLSSASIIIFYELGEKRVFVETVSGPLSEEILYLKFKKDDDRFEKHIKLYLLTGLADEYTPDP